MRSPLISTKLAEYQPMIEKLEYRRRQLQEFYGGLQVDTGEGEEEELPQDEAQARSQEH